MSADSRSTRPAEGPKTVELSYAFLDGERRLLESIAGGAPIEVTLGELIRLIESELPDALCAVLELSVDRELLTVVAASTMPDDVREALVWIPAKEGMGSCGTAIARAARVVIENFADDPLGQPFAEIAARNGIRSCWSQPIALDRLEPVGSFAIMRREPCRPSGYEIAVIEAAAHLAGIALDRHRSDAARSVQLATFELLNDAVVVTDVGGTILDCNPAASKLWGYAKDEMVGRNVGMLFSRDAGGPTPNEIGKRALRDGRWQGECSFQRKNGTRGVRELSLVRMLDDASRATGFVGVSRDITERKGTESEREAVQAKMLQMQKLESLGLMAGGIAHDFNNLLTGILGNAELGLETVAPTSPVHGWLRAIVESSSRAADLTRQMLSYSGGATFERMVVDLSEEVREIGALIASSVPKKVELRFELATGMPAIDADRTQLQQLMMNLVINAAEAIGDDVGEVVVSTYTSRCSGREPTLRHPPSGLPAAEYVTLEVRDDGCGMDEAMIARIFDPFFTTKFTGRGLGLAGVLGIVRGHGGGLKVESKVGEGTVFRVVFPIATAQVESPRDERSSERATGAAVLVIDDEPVVLELAHSVLSHYGYEVLTASSGERGLALFAENRERIGVVVLDLTMPRRDGREILRELRQLDPHVSVVLSSGFSELEVVRQFAPGAFACFLQKPYSPKTLVNGVRFALERGRPA